jgi:hypothetical protein
MDAYCWMLDAGCWIKCIKVGNPLDPVGGAFL